MAMFAEHRKLLLAAVLVAAGGAAQAQDAKTQAQTGAVADGVSSFVGIAAGAPVNPLLPVIGLGFKAATFQHAESLPETERPRAYAFAAAGWHGSAAGNICAAASALTGGSFLPACVVIGVAYGWKTWNVSERERMDAQRCAAQRASKHKPKLRCTPSKVRMPPAPVQASTFIAAQDLVAP